MSESFADEPLFHDVKVEDLSWGRDLSNSLQQKEGLIDDEEEDDNDVNHEILFAETIGNCINLDHIPANIVSCFF